MDHSILVKEISAADTYIIRQPVLRPGKPFTDCLFPGDNDEETFHLGLFNTNYLVGVASFMKAQNINFTAPHQYQLRGMAVLQSHKGKGYGAAILHAGEHKLHQLNKDFFLWFNARDYAIGFYERYGYKTFGEKFDIPGVCPHIVMYK